MTAERVPAGPAGPGSKFHEFLGLLARTSAREDRANRDVSTKVDGVGASSPGMGIQVQVKFEYFGHMIGIRFISSVLGQGHRIKSDLAFIKILEVTLKFP